VHELPQFILDRALAREPIFTADEVAAWPDGLLDQLLEDGVLKATGNAASVTCDACGQDHVETVECIESPPGTGLRAYIPCPENGRVRVSLARLRCWIVNKEKIPPSVDTLAGAPAAWPEEFFRDEDGTPLTARILSERLGIPDSRLKHWREKGCPDLDGERLAAKKVSGVGWVYCRIHVNQIANRRDDRARVDAKLDLAARLEAASKIKRDQQSGGPRTNSR